MKQMRAAVLGLSLSLLSGLALGQPGENPVKAPPKNVPAPALQPVPSDDNGGLLFADPTIQFEKIEHDFGKIFDDKPVDVEFKFKNSGGGPLIITNVQTSCGCTTPDWDRQRKQYNSGESGTIKIRFDPAHKAGMQTKTITVESNDRSNPRAQLAIKTNIVPLVQLDPTYLAFEPLQKGQGATKIVKVTGRREGFKVADVTVSPSEIFTAKVLGTKPAEINGEMLAQSEIEVSVKPGVPVGRFSATMQIQTNEERSKPMPLGLSGEILGDLVVTPQQLMLGVVAPGAEFSGEVKVARRDGRAWTLKGAEIRNAAQDSVKPEMNVVATKAEKGEGQTIKISGKAPDQAGYRYTGELVLATDVPGEEAVRIRILLTVRPNNAGSPGGPVVPQTNPPKAPYPTKGSDTLSPTGGVPAVKK